MIGASPRTYRFISDRLLLRSSAVFAASYLFEGPLRFALVLLHAELLLYSRDLLAALLVALVAAGWCAGQTGATPLITILGVLLAHACVGFLSLPSPMQPLMGLKILLPALLGIVVAPLVPKHVSTVRSFATFAFLATVAGLILNTLVEYPWVGLSYETSLASVEVSRSWTSAGNLRLPGFTRASFMAAAICLSSMVPALAGRRALLRPAFVALCAVGILLTTTKGAWTGLTAWILCETVAAALGPRAWACCVSLLAGACLALPLATTHLRVRLEDVQSWQVSFLARIHEMWPDAFGLLDDPVQALWGRGIGGIGMAQTLGEWHRFNAADNLMVYVLVTYGVFGLIYIAVAMKHAFVYVSSRASHDFSAALVRGWLAIWLSFGLTTNMLEDTSMELVIGVVFGLTMRMMRLQGSALAAFPHAKLHLVNRKQPREVALEQLYSK